MQKEGPKAFFRSYKVTVLMNIPFSATLVSMNENLKVMAKPEDQKYMFSYYFGCAFIAGLVAAALTNPLDVTKTRL